MGAGQGRVCARQKGEAGTRLEGRNLEHDNDRKGGRAVKATGVVRRIDDLGRVVIPKEIRRTLRIREGSPLEIFTDRDGEIILKRYSPINEVSDFAQEYVESLHESTGHVAFIFDDEEVVAVSGAPKKALLGRTLSDENRQLLEQRRTLILTDHASDFLPGLEFTHLCVSPILKDGNVAGAVALASKNQQMGELEKKLTETAAQFLAKQLN